MSNLLMDSDFCRSQDRDVGIDFAKGVCILLVVWGHLPRTGTWSDVFYWIVTTIYAFHIPVFIFISGYLFGLRTGSAEDFKKVVCHVFKPYFVVGLLMLWIYAIAARLGIQTLGGGASPLWMRLLTGHAGGALWYLYTLGLFELLTLAWLRLGKKFGDQFFNPLGIVALGAVASLTCTKFEVVDMQPWFFLYFFIGYFARRIFQNRLPASPFFILPLIVTMAYFRFDRNSLGNFIVVISILSLLLWMGREMMAMSIGRIFSFLGRKSLPILLFHPICIGIVRPIYAIGLRYDATGISSMILTCACVTFMSLVLDRLLVRRKLMRIIY